MVDELVDKLPRMEMLITNQVYHTISDADPRRQELVQYFNKMCKVFAETEKESFKTSLAKDPDQNLGNKLDQLQAIFGKIKQLLHPPREPNQKQPQGQSNNQTSGIDMTTRVADMVHELVDKIPRMEVLIANEVYHTISDADPRRQELVQYFNKICEVFAETEKESVKTLSAKDPDQNLGKKLDQLQDIFGKIKQLLHPSSHEPSQKQLQGQSNNQTSGQLSDSTNVSNMVDKMEPQVTKTNVSGMNEVGADVETPDAAK